MFVNVDSTPSIYDEAEIDKFICKYVKVTLDGYSLKKKEKIPKAEIVGLLMYSDVCHYRYLKSKMRYVIARPLPNMNFEPTTTTFDACNVYDIKEASWEEVKPDMSEALDSEEYGEWLKCYNKLVKGWKNKYGVTGLK